MLVLFVDEAVAAFPELAAVADGVFFPDGERDAEGLAAVFDVD